MKKLTKFIFACVLAFSFAAAGVNSLSQKTPIQAKADGAHSVGFAIKEHSDVYFEETGNNKVQNTVTGQDGKLAHLPELYRTDSLDFVFNGWFIQNTETKVDIDTVYNSDTVLVDRWTYTAFDVDHKVSSVTLNNPTLALGTKQGEYTASTPTVNVDGVTGGTSFIIYKGLNKSGDPLVGEEEVEIGKNYSVATTITLKNGFKFDDQIKFIATNGLAADYKFKGNFWTSNWSTSANQVEVIINFIASDDYYFLQQPESRELENYSEYHYYYLLNEESSDPNFELVDSVQLQYWNNSAWTLFGPATMVVSPYANRTIQFRLAANYQHGVLYSEPWTISWSCLNPNISSISLGVDSPVNGGSPSYSVSKGENRFAFTSENGETIKNGVKWNGSVSGDLNVTSGTFNNSEDYTISVKLVAQDGYTFDVANMAAKINSQEAVVSGDSETVTVSYTFQKAAPITHKVYFSSGFYGLGDMDPVTVMDGEEYTLPNCSFTPVTNYEFSTWSVKGEYKKPGDTILVKDDVYVFAVWQATSTPASEGFVTQPVGGTVAAGTHFTVNFAVDNSIQFNSVSALYYDEVNDVWEALVSPSGYVYYEEDSRIVSASFSSDLVKSYVVRLYAFKDGVVVAKSDTFVVNFVEAQVLTQPQSAKVNIGDKYTITWETNLNARYRILCWNEGNGDWDNVGETTGNSYQVTSNVATSKTYKIVSDVPYKMSNGQTNYDWEVLATQSIIVEWAEPAPTEYLIVYTPGDGSGSNDMDYVTAGTEIALANPQTLGFEAPDGQEFDAWSIGGVRYNVGASYTVNADTYIIALWKDVEIPQPTQYTISFDAGEGTGNMAAIIKDENATYALPECTFTAPSGKHFAGWKIGADEILRQVGYQITVTGNITITAIWEQDVIPQPTQYTVSFNANGGTGSMNSVPQDENATYTLPANGFNAPQGKEFAGWKLNGQGDLLQPGATITITANVELVAQWKDIEVVPPTQYTITFDSNNGTGSMNPVQINEGEQYALPQNGFTAPEGKEFAGWQVGNDATIRQPGYQLTVNGDVIITAQWKDKDVTPVDPEPVTPEPQPEPTPSDGGETTPETPTKKKGCGGSIVATSAIISITSLLGVGLLVFKKKEDK